MNELIMEGDIQYKPAEILFPKYEEMKKNALDLADRISKVEVTEENIKAVKKDLAQVRKIITELNNRRKVVKAEILRNYNTFEAQIKEIDGIIASAEELIRTQVKVIEEQERARKYDDIREIWDKRIGQYDISTYGNFFEKWLQPSHLNKTTSMKSIEEDMVKWLETRQKDMEVLTNMGGEYLVEYIECLDMAEAIAAVNRRKVIQNIVEEDDSQQTAIFVITGDKDIRLTESLLKENNIEYRRTK